MPQLSTAHITTITELVEPFCSTENDRRALIDLIFAGVAHKPDIDTSGAPLVFTRRLIFRLRDYGDIESDKPALWALLETIRPQVGVDKQAQIDALRPVIWGNTDVSLPTADPTYQHVFLSYSRRDTAFLDRLAHDLEQRGIATWVDRSGLKPGTRSWDAELRRVVRDSFAVLLIASPDSGKSDYVYGELALAELYQREVIPVWANGDHWIDCVPLGLSRAQYVDARGQAYASALNTLVPRLQELQGRIIQQTQTTAQKTATSLTAPNPYKALDAFTKDDAGRFYGRAKLVEELLTALQTTNFLPIIGASGAGKSSLMQAGVLPRLAAGALPGSDKWSYLEPFTPGTHPLEQLAIKLAKVQGGAITDLLKDLEAPRGLVLLSQRLTSDRKQRLVIPIDQFEELYTQTASDDERRAFLRLLTHAILDRDSLAVILLTLRADFYDRPLNEAEFGALLAQHQQVARAMTPEELRDAIESPAQAVGAVFEDGVAGDLLFEARDQAGALPLLQYTLYQLYEQRDGQRLTGAAYRAMGGVRGALTQRADQLYQQLDDDEKRLTQRLFLRLADVQGGNLALAVRRRVTTAELMLPDADQQATQDVLLAKFVTARLLTADDDSLEVSHEALLRQWTTAQDWLAAAQTALRIQRRVTQDAAEWENQQRPTDRLYRGTVLAEAEQWAAAHSPSVLELAFIHTSRAHEAAQIAAEEQRKQELIAAGDRAERQRKRARLAIGLAVIVGIFAAALILAATQQVTDANTQAALADTQVADANNQLAAVPPTLTRVAEVVAEGETYAAALELAARARDVYNGSPFDEPLGIALALAASEMSAAPQTERTLAELAYPPGARMSLQGHTNYVRSAAYSPDGTRIVTASSDDTAIVWDAATGQILRRLVGHTSVVTSAAFSPDGTRIVTASQDDTAIVWDAETGEILHRLEGHTSGVNSAAYSPDGTRIVTALVDSGGDGEEDEGGEVIVWNAATGQRLHRLEGHTSDVNSTAFSPDGTRIVTASQDRTAIVWDAATGEIIRRLEGHTNIVWSAAFSPDGTRIVTASGDTFSGEPGEVIVWDTATGQILRRMEGHTDTVTSAAYSPDGTRLVTASCEKVKNSDCVEGAAYVWASVDTSPSDAATGQILRRLEGHKGDINSAAYSPDGTRIVTASWDNTAIIWDAATGQILRRLVGHTTGVLSAAYSPDGTRIVTAEGSLMRIEPGEVIVWDTATGEILRRLEGHTSWVLSATFSPDGTRIVTASSDGTAIVWDSTTGQILRRLEGHTGGVTSAAYSPDGTRIVTASWDGTAIVWDSATGEILRRLEGHTGGVTSAAFSPDGTRIVTASADGTVIIWRNDTLAQLQAWVRENRYMPELTCEQRVTYGVRPLCEGETLPPTPMHRPTETPVGVIPVWTPIDTPTATATPSARGTAQIGLQRGELLIGGRDVWRYAGVAGETITITTVAEWDTVLDLVDSDGAVLPSYIDLYFGFTLPADGEYIILVSGYGNAVGGAYTLNIASSRGSSVPPTPTP